MLGSPHVYVADESALAYGQAWYSAETRPCTCGLPRSNAVHDLPPAPPLDARQAAAGDYDLAMPAPGDPERVLHKSSWCDPSGDHWLAIEYDDAQLGADGPVVEVVAGHLSRDIPVMIPLAVLEAMVASIRRRQLQARRVDGA